MTHQSARGASPAADEVPAIEVADTLAALRGATLEQIDGRPWGPAPDDASYVVRTAHHLRTVPLGDFTAEDLRLLIGQHVDLDVLVPMAVGVLRMEPLVAGEMYAGDLLAAVLRVPAGWFDRHSDVAVALDGVVGKVDLDALDAYGQLVLGETEVPELVDRWRRSRQTSA